MQKKIQKKSKKTSKPIAKPSTICSKSIKNNETALHDLENAVLEIYQDFPLAQTFANLTDSKQMSKMIAALSGTLDSLHIEELTQGLFPNPKEDERFAKNLSSVLYSLKNLSKIVTDNISKNVE
ncbi:hypothetical protein [Chlamydia sp. 17-3921]|uniref:hypothetical protein n=1 Tax=Chlamydia sp. 17-3921 TaxID=2675798 RepID=UPI00191B5604|nr:hypothetical protein [Chlamydia sp. 17-3921]